MGTFRDRMDEELRLRGYAATTRETYLRIVRNFVTLPHAPSGPTDLRRPHQTP